MTWYALAVFISDKSDLEKLNFRPRGHHFHLAQVEWKNVVLNSQCHGDQPIVDLSPRPLAECLFHLFGPLSLIELSELFTAIDEFPKLMAAFDTSEFMQSQGRQWSERQAQLFTTLQKTPLAFREWAHQKQMGSKDLQPLLAIEDLEAFAPLLIDLAENSLSRNEGKQAIDLLVDLFLLKRSVADLRSPQTGSWLKNLNKLRRPQSLKNEAAQSTDIGWPQYVQVVNQRQGDRLLKKMQITYSDGHDLTQKLKRLADRESHT